MLSLIDILSKILLGSSTYMLFYNISKKKKSDSSKVYESWKIWLTAIFGVALTFFVSIIENSIELGLF